MFNIEREIRDMESETKKKLKGLWYKNIDIRYFTDLVGSVHFCGSWYRYNSMTLKQDYCCFHWMNTFFCSIELSYVRFESN